MSSFVAGKLFVLQSHQVLQGPRLPGPRHGSHLRVRSRRQARHRSRRRRRHQRPPNRPRRMGRPHRPIPTRHRRPAIRRRSTNATTPGHRGTGGYFPFDPVRYLCHSGFTPTAAIPVSVVRPPSLSSQDFTLLSISVLVLPGIFFENVTANAPLPTEVILV